VILAIFAEAAEVVRSPFFNSRENGVIGVSVDQHFSEFVSTFRLRDELRAGLADVAFRLNLACRSWPWVGVLTTS
jgi:hypothetical protein